MAREPSSPQPSGPPAIRRRLECTVGGHDKYYLIEAWQMRAIGNTFWVRIAYGRHQRGTRAGTMAHDYQNWTSARIEEKVREQRLKGYHEVVPAAQAVNVMLPTADAPTPRMEPRAPARPPAPNTPPPRRILNATDFHALVSTEIIRRSGRTGGSFTSTDVTEALRERNPYVHISHSEVREIVLAAWSANMQDTHAMQATGDRHNSVRLTPRMAPRGAARAAGAAAAPPSDPVPTPAPTRPVARSLGDVIDFDLD